jgi:hypothetical protein
VYVLHVIACLITEKYLDEGRHNHLAPDSGNCDTYPKGTFIHTPGDHVALVPADATSVHHHLLPPPSPAPHHAVHSSHASVQSSGFQKRKGAAGDDLALDLAWSSFFGDTRRDEREAPAVSKLSAEPPSSRSRRNAKGARDGAIGAKTASAEMPKTALSEEELRPPTTTRGPSYWQRFESHHAMPSSSTKQD